jgi:hypothetical protein
MWLLLLTSGLSMPWRLGDIEFFFWKEGFMMNGLSV